MSIFPTWPSSDEFYAAASRPEGVGLFKYLAAHRSVRRNDAAYRRCLYRHYGISVLYAICFIPSIFIDRIFQHDLIAIPIQLSLCIFVVLIATPIYAKSCVQSGTFMKRQVLEQLASGTAIGDSQVPLHSDPIG